MTDEQRAETAHWDECLACGHFRRRHWLGLRCDGLDGHCDCAGFLAESVGAGDDPGPAKNVVPFKRPRRRQ